MRFSPKGGNPVTLGIIGLTCLMFVLAWLGLRSTLVYWLAFDTATLSAHPWTVLTYPFAQSGFGPSLFWFLLSMLWLFSFGSAVERDLGQRRFTFLWIVATLLGAVALLLGAFLLKTGVGLSSIMLPVSFITVTWCGRNPNASIVLFGIVPLLGKYLAVLSVLLVLFAMGEGSPMMGILAAAPLAIAWLFGQNKLVFAPYGGAKTGGVYRPKSAAEKKREDERHFEFQEDIRRKQKEREEKERLRKLLEGGVQEGDRKD